MKELIVKGVDIKYKTFNENDYILFVKDTNFNALETILGETCCSFAISFIDNFV